MKCGSGRINGEIIVKRKGNGVMNKLGIDWEKGLIDMLVDVLKKEDGKNRNEYYNCWGNLRKR